MASHDWSTSELGPPQNWPAPLQTIVALMLDAQVAMWAGWGPSLSMLYNAQYAELLGDKHPAALGRPLREVWAEIWPDIAGLVSTALSGQTIYQDDLPLRINRYGNDEQAWFSFSYGPIRDDRGVVQGIACTVWETTRRVLDRRKLQESQARLLALTRASSNVIYRISADWKEMLELDGQGFVADTSGPDPTWLDNYIAPQDQEQVSRAIAAALRDRTMFELEHRVIRTDGTLGWTLSRAVPMFGPGGDIVEWFGMATDVTARKEAEARLIESDRLKDQFLATLAHELRNPLAPIRNGLQIVRASTDRRDADAALRMLDRQVDHLVRLVDDLMEVARISSGALELQCARTELAGTIQSAIELSRPAIEAGGHSLQIRFPAEELYVHGDEVRLAQVFSNLLNNAARYSPEPGLVEISMAREGSDAVVRVVDHGQGIAAADLGRLFTLFGRLGTGAARGDGLGVGLALAKRLLELHGGTIAADSGGAGTGSCFTVRLPLSQAAALTPVARAERAEHAFEGLDVMIVDDNVDAAESLGALIGILGGKVAVFHSGRVALEALDALDGVGEVMPALALLDIGMPDIDGNAMARAIRADERHRGIVLVAVTGWGQAEDRERTKAAGFDHHLVKPIQIEALEAIARTVSRKTEPGRR